MYSRPGVVASHSTHHSNLDGRSLRKAERDLDKVTTGSLDGEHEPHPYLLPVCANELAVMTHPSRLQHALIKFAAALTRQWCSAGLS